MEKYVIGNIRRIIYESASSTYKVGILKLRETNIEELSDYVDRTITFTGNFSEVNNELDYKLNGILMNHPKYGIQFNTLNYEIVTPSDEEGIMMYLSSGLFKGIGIKTAKKIVDKYHTDALNKIKEDYTCLLSIKGIKETTAKKMQFKLNELDKSQELILRLNGLGFSTKESLNLVNKYSMNLKNILESNIYELSDEINFIKLDNIFMSMYEEKDERRIKALFKHVIMSYCYECGDTLISKEVLFLTINKYFKEKVSSNDFNLYINILKDDNIIIEIGDYIILYNIYEKEHYISETVKYLNKIKSSIKDNLINKYIKEYEINNNITFNIDQKEAIKGSLINNLFIISGGPGTGKTTIIKAIVDIYKKIDKNIINSDIALLAPTGRSAKRMSESTGLSSYTIHRFLKWNKETSSFGIDIYNKSSVKLVIVDEMSMIDVFLFSSLLEGLQNRIKLILVGDVNQLPSIGPGNVLESMILSQKVPYKYLNDVYRTASNSFILDFASLIRDKKEIESFDTKYSDFKFIESTDLYTKEYLKEICLKLKEKNILLENFQVMAPMYKTENGVDNLNTFMQSIFNPKDENKNEIVFLNKTFREGDKVIQLENDVDNNVFNGDIGFIKSIYKVGSTNTIIIDYMGIKVEYKSGDFDKFTLAYAVTIHKSQGSEYDTCIIILSPHFNRMLYNKLIYTAVTRAKKGLMIIGNIDTLNKAIETDYASNRISLLKNLLDE